MVCGWHAVRKRAADCHDSSVYTYIFSMTLAHLLQTDYVCVGIILIFATNKNCNDDTAHVTQVSIDNNRWRHWNIAITCIYITSMLCITVYRPYMLYRKLPFEASVKLRLFIFFNIPTKVIARAGTTMNDTNVVDVFTHSRLCGCAIRTRWDVHNLFQLSMTYSVFQLIHLRAANLWFLLICSAIIIIRLFAHILWCLLAQLIRMCVCVSVWLGAELNFDLVEWIHVNCQ